jgi:PAS domain S-box-containing protein
MASDSGIRAIDEGSFDFLSYMRNKMQELEGTENGQSLLKRSEERFKVLYRDAPFGYDSLDENAVILEVNAAWLNFLGYSKEEVIGKPFVDFLTPEFKEDFQNNWETTKKIGIVNDVKLRFRRKDGTIMDAVLYGRVLYDSSGKFIQTHGITYDLTERKKADEALKKSEREKALILDVMSDRVMYLDKDMNVIWANKNAASPFSLKPEQLVGTLCFKTLYNRDTPCEGCPIERSLRTLEPEESELALGTSIMVVRSYPILDQEDRLSGVVNVSRDITERKNLERDILDIDTKARQDLGRDLHDGLGQLLTGLTFLGKALQEQLASSGLPEARDAAKISDIAERALSITRNMAKGLSPVGLENEGCLGAISDLAITTESLFGVSCSFNTDNLPCRIDTGLSIHLYYIAQEAINNAIKHGKAKNISITMHCEDEKVFLSIKDDGCGLSGGAKQAKGMGLRTMSYRAGVLGGVLTIRNNGDRGATLTCCFPLMKGPKQ